MRERRGHAGARAALREGQPVHPLHRQVPGRAGRWDHGRAAQLLPPGAASASLNGRMETEDIEQARCRGSRMSRVRRRMLRVRRRAGRLAYAPGTSEVSWGVLYLRRVLLVAVASDTLRAELEPAHQAACRGQAENDALGPPAGVLAAHQRHGGGAARAAAYARAQSREAYESSDEEDGMPRGQKVQCAQQ